MFEVGDQVKVVGPESNPWCGRTGTVVQALGDQGPFPYVVSVDDTQIVAQTADLQLHARPSPPLDPDDDLPWDRWHAEWEAQCRERT